MPDKIHVCNPYSEFGAPPSCTCLENLNRMVREGAAVITGDLSLLTIKTIQF